MTHEIKIFELTIIAFLSFMIIDSFAHADPNFNNKWSKSASQIGIIGESFPVLADVNGDGYKEIFWAGKPWNDRGNSYAHLVCVDGMTGNILWDKPYLQYWGSGNEMRHLPVMGYDFDKDGQQEVIAAGGTYCRNALTGQVEWSNSKNYFGWHKNGFVDFQDEKKVTLYT